MTVKIRKNRKWWAAFLLGAIATQVGAQTVTCNHRGELDALYCDENRDLLADAPKNSAQYKNPAELIFSYSPIEEPMMFAKVWRPFADYLGQCIGKPIKFRAIQTNTTEIDALRTGKLHLAAFSTGTTGFAVNLAGAVPFAAKGTADGIQGYQLIVLVRKDRSFANLSDLKGKTIAHTTATSNSGNLAPRAFFPAYGLSPDVDYRVAYSGKHDQSVLGVVSGDYDAAVLSSSVFDRMVKRGQVKAADLKIIFRSDPFPTSAFVHAHDLAQELIKDLHNCFFNFQFSDELKSVFDGATRFVPIDFQRDWRAVRQVAKTTGTAYDAATYAKLNSQENSPSAKKKNEE
jgi:phosphonate transport system substrate-binding protein